MKIAFARLACMIVVVVALTGLAWLIQGNDFILYRTFAPKYEQVRYDTFKQSQSYNEGVAQELENLRAQYVTASPDQQQALASIILHRANGYGEQNLPPDLRLFVHGLRNGSAK